MEHLDGRVGARNAQHPPILKRLDSEVGDAASSPCDGPGREIFEWSERSGYGVVKVAWNSPSGKTNLSTTETRTASMSV